MGAKRGLIIMLLALMLALCGCYSGIINEEYPNTALAQIDPDDGITNEKVMKLFFRVTGEGLLTPIEQRVTVLAGESDENAMVRALIESDLSQREGIESLIPKSTRIVDVMLDGSLLYVTLTNGFFDNSAISNTRRDVDRLVKSGVLDDEEAARRIEYAESETYLARRLAVQSIVNTICANAVDAGNGQNISVQILFEWNGDAVRVTRSDLGFESFSDADQDLLEPMEFDESIVATPGDIVACVLGHLQMGEYHKIYPHISKSSQNGTNIGSYAEFETAMTGLKKITAYTIVETEGEGDNVTVYADITAATNAAGKYKTTRKAFVLKDDGGIYRLNYAALIDALGGGQ